MNVLCLLESETLCNFKLYYMIKESGIMYEVDLLEAVIMYFVSQWLMAGRKCKKTSIKLNEHLNDICIQAYIP